MRHRKLAILAASLIVTTSSASAAERATILGKVVDAVGQPMEHATVLVYEAHVKEGYSIYCPTCWADCGKHVVTGADGSFAISGLNADLLFRLLVAKDGFSATFVDKVDPAAGPAPTSILKARKPIEDASRTVRGLVVDGHGAPLRDAVVEQEGVTFRGPRGIGRQFGPDDWVDLIAVTNERGEFEIAYAKPAIAFTLSVNARGMAPKLVTEPTGPDRKRITVSEGAVIRGRLVQPNGTPVPNAEIGLSTHSAWAGTSLPEVTIGTKEDGTFAITNVPAGRIWLIYPKMASLAARGLASEPLPCETRDDGQEVDVGDMQLRPAYALRGRIVLNDGKPIPADMHVTLQADHGADAQMATVQSDGRFEFLGLYKGVYGLSPGVRGYKLAEDVTGEVLVERDRSDVTFRMEPAPSR